MNDDEEFRAVLRELKNIGIELPPDVTRASFSHDLQVVLQQTAFMRDDSEEMHGAITRAMQFSANDPDSAKAIVDAQLESNSYLRTMSKH